MKISLSPREDTFHGITLEKDVVLEWRPIGRIDSSGTFRQLSGAHGLYAFVLVSNQENEPNRQVVLYVGKAGGIKPGQATRWANDIQKRVTEHWDNGPFRGLAKTLQQCYHINLWAIDLKSSLGKIWERDIELIENTYIRTFKNKKIGDLPGNSAVEGSSSRRFKIEVVEPFKLPLPSIRMLSGITEDTRRPKTR